LKIRLNIPRIKIPLDIDDAFILAGTAAFTFGLWGYDWRAALMALGMWLIFLGRPKRGGS